LGNVRLVFTESNGLASIVQENHYYPFGMQQNGNWAKTQTVKNDYLYNGKELNTDLGLNWSDYGFRFYDPVIARFTGVDPISDQFPHVTIYNYAENSPIAHIDLWGLQAVFFQVTGRIGVSGSVIPGPTVSGALGVAADLKGNVMVYHAESGGLGFGAYAGGGVEGGVNFGVDNVDGLLGWGVNAGAVAGVSPLGGPQFGAEGNISISSDEGESLGSGDNGGGFTASAGGGIGFLGYVDLSYTSEIARFTIYDIEMAGQELINQLSELLGTNVSDSQRDYIMENVRNLRTTGPLSNNDNQETCEEECKQ